MESKKNSDTAKVDLSPLTKEQGSIMLAALESKFDEEDSARSTKMISRFKLVALGNLFVMFGLFR